MICMQGGVSGVKMRTSLFLEYLVNLNCLCMLCILILSIYSELLQKWFHGICPTRAAFVCSNKPNWPRQIQIYIFNCIIFILQIINCFSCQHCISVSCTMLKQTKCCNSHLCINHKDWDGGRGSANIWEILQVFLPTYLLQNCTINKHRMRNINLIFFAISQHTVMQLLCGKIFW